MIVTVLKIVMISLVGLLVGAAVLFGIVSGPLAVLALPVLAIFGWFYIFPIFLSVALLWAIYQPAFNRARNARLLVMAGCWGGTLLMTLIGVKGPEPIWLAAYAVGGLVAGGVCAALVVVLKGAQP